MIRRIVLLVAFAALLPCLAPAGDISFSTSGTLSSPSLFPISFSGNPSTTFVGGNIAFGLFDVTACPLAKCSGSETFTLTVTETSPISGTAHLVGTISGEVLKDGYTALTLTFTADRMTIGKTVYLIPFMQSLNVSFTTLNGSVNPMSAVSEPSAALLLGIGALGLVGLATVFRKMIV